MKVRPLVVFDMDGVLVEDRSSWRRVHDHVGTQNEDSFQAYMNREIDDLEFMRRDIGRWVEKAPEISRDMIKRILLDSRRMKGFPDITIELKKMGVETLILSGGIDILADHLAEEGVITHSIANGIEFDEEGMPTGEGILRVPLRDKGSVLGSYIHEMGPFSPILTVGDSIVDITMFKISDVSIAFRPEEEEVEQRATEIVKGGNLMLVEDIIIRHITETHNNLL